MHGAGLSGWNFSGTRLCGAHELKLYPKRSFSEAFRYVE